jgi:hypothetical protein
MVSHVADRNRKNPSSLLFWNDLRAELRRCSPGAKALWTVHMLPCAAESEEYGVMIVGSAPSLREDLGELLCQEFGQPADVTQALIEELILKGVAAVDDKGRVYNRRMVREEAERQAKIRAGRRGGKASGDVRRAKQTPKQTPQQERSRSRSSTPSRSEAGSASASDGNQREISDKSTTDAKQTASEDRSRPPSKTEPSSIFMLQASKEEVTNTGVETTVGHAAEAGGRDSRDDPAAGSKPAKPKATNRGTRIPDDWSPTPEQEQFARDRGLDPAEVALEFRTYWAARPGRDALKLDWGLTFKNQCIKLSGRLHSSRPQAVAVRRAERQSDLEQFASGAMSAGSAEPRKGILNR